LKCPRVEISRIWEPQLRFSLKLIYQSSKIEGGAFRAALPGEAAWDLSLPEICYQVTYFLIVAVDLQNAIEELAAS
jgi:hypothetical protein